MAITIPKEHAGGLARMLAFSTEENARVVESLKKGKSIRSKELTQLLKEALPNRSDEEITEIVGTLASLFLVRTGMDSSLDAFVKDLITAANPDEVHTTTDELQQNVKALLGVRPLSILAKARGVHTDHENTFCNVRILTDLRPVFDIDVKQDPAGFVVAHILKLGFHHVGRHTTIHIAMDKTDVDSLIQALQRAKDKAATLSRVTAKCGYQILAE
jgi:hypothetical protein